MNMFHLNRLHLATVSFGLALTSLSCSNHATAPTEQSPFTYVSPYAWTTSDPASTGIDTVLFQTALDNLTSLPYVYSTLVVHDSLLIAEYYQGYLSKLNDYDIRSASKSFISALMGIALQRGLIDSLGQRVYSFFPEFDTTGMDPRKREITLRHLLTMRAGFDYSEGADYSAIFTPQANWVREILKFPLKYNPGERFYYSTIQTHLLSVILARVSGMSTLEFAKKNLFDPLSIGIRAWYKDPQGYYYGGTGMNFTARDLARFGYLYLRHGQLNGTQIVPQSWITQTVQPQNSTPLALGPFTNVNYGFSWWTETNPSDSLFMALGFACQIVMVAPGKDLVMVVTTNTDVASEAAADNQISAVAGIINQYLLPSVPAANPLVRAARRTSSGS